MARKKRENMSLFSVIGFGLIVLGVVIGIIIDNGVCGIFAGLGLCFLAIFLHNKSEYRKVRRTGVLVNAYVTDCEKGDSVGPNDKDRFYFLTCEAEDERVYGTAVVRSETYVPIGRRIVLFSSKSMNIVCPAKELEAMKTDFVMLTASLVCILVAVGAYLVVTVGITLSSKENVVRIGVMAAALVFSVMGLIFLWIAANQKKQTIETHRHSAKLVNYKYGTGGKVYPVWRYYYKGERVEYESKTEKRLWQKIGRISEVFVTEDGDVFEKSEISDSVSYGIIFLFFGISDLLLCSFMVK